MNIAIIMSSGKVNNVKIGQTRIPVQKQQVAFGEFQDFSTQGMGLSRLQSLLKSFQMILNSYQLLGNHASKIHFLLSRRRVRGFQVNPRKHGWYQIEKNRWHLQQEMNIGREFLLNVQVLEGTVCKKIAKIEKFQRFQKNGSNRKSTLILLDIISIVTIMKCLGYYLMRLFFLLES